MIRQVIRNIGKDLKLYEDSLHPSLQLLCKIFGNDRRPPAYILGFEVLHYLQSEKLLKAFPIMASDYSVHKNIMLLHFSLVNQRLLYEETRESLKESAKLFEMCEKSLFERYLDLVEDIIEVPVADFESELVEMLIKDFESLDSSIACYGYNKPYIVLEYKPNYDFSKVILNEIFENKIAPYDPQVSLLSKYFADHKSYLENLTYNAFLTEKVLWGLNLLDK